MHLATAPGIVTGDAPISYWPIFFSVLRKSQKSLQKLTGPTSFSFLK